MMKQGVHSVLCALLIAFSPCLKGQHIIYVDSIQVFSVEEKTSFLVSHKTSEILQSHWEEGYLFSQITTSDSAVTHIYKGKTHSFKIGSVTFSDSSSVFLDGKKKRDVFSFLDKQVQFWSQIGFPFASFQVINVYNRESELFADIRIEKGPYIIYDEVFLINESSTSKKQIEKTLDIERGEAYNEKSFELISRIIDRLPYLSINEDPDIAFEEGKAIIYLDLEEKNSDSFEGILGLLPGQSNDKFLITGYIDLELNNLFSSGKSFTFEWNRFAAQSQSLSINYKHPFLLDTKLLFDVRFSLFKQDTSFLNQDLQIAVGSYLAGNWFFQTGYEKSTANLVSTNLESIKANNIVDYNRDIYTLSLMLNEFNSAIGFKEDLKLQSNISFGRKRINRNPNIDFEFYDTITTKTNILNIETKVKYQKILGKRLAVFHEIESGLLYNDQLLNNEMFRIGGLKSLRGFNENFYYASHYALSRMELRQYFESESYFMLLYDQLFYQNNLQEDYPFGLGLGFSLSSNNSLFNFAMAVGKSKDIPIDISNAKIHFGYTSRF